MPNLFNTDFLEFSELLEKHEVDFLLVGGYAVILDGFVRSTGDGFSFWSKQESLNN